MAPGRMLRAGHLAVATVLIAATAAAQNPSGRSEFEHLCSDCHEIGPGARVKVGPPLTGVVGRPIAVIENFPYSFGLRLAGSRGGRWSLALLDRWLANPRAVAPDTRMLFPGLPNAAERTELIRFLSSYKSGAPSRSSPSAN